MQSNAVFAVCSLKCLPPAKKGIQKPGIAARSDVN
jgi:hypothetical protein